MYETIRLAQTDVRILFLDPDGEQARFRSYREYLLKPLRRQIEYHAFTDELQRESTLWVNTHAAINQLIAWIEEFRKDTSWVCRVRARKYRSAPVSFLVQIGDRMLTEPYNYGKLGGPSNVPVTLGTDMPLFEFQGEVPAMFDDVEYRKHTLNLRNPFRLVMNHFDFAFETGVEIPLLGRESSAAAGT